MAIDFPILPINLEDHSTSRTADPRNSWLAWELDGAFTVERSEARHPSGGAPWSNPRSHMDHMQGSWQFLQSRIQ